MKTAETTNNPLRVLLLEDNEADAGLITHALVRAGFTPDWKRVDRAGDYASALREDFDLILADFNLPQFDALAALSILRQRRTRIPFIIVSGTIGEEAAVAAIKAGAYNYVSKNQLGRLGQVVQQALNHKRVEEERDAAEEALRRSEAHKRAILSSAIDCIVALDEEGTILEFNPAAELAFGYSRGEVLGQKIAEKLLPGVLAKSVQLAAAQSTSSQPSVAEIAPQATRDSSQKQRWETKAIRNGGSEFPVELTIGFVPDAEPRIFTAFIRDISVRKRTERTERSLVVLSSLWHRLSSAKSAREAGELIAEAADELLGWDACTIDLYSPGEKEVNQILKKDLINGARIECTVPGGYMPSPCVLRTLAEGAQLILRRPPFTPAEGTRPFGDTSRPSASLMFVPMRDGAKTIGVLSIQSYTQNAYDRQDLATLQSLADQCGGALSRIQSEEAQARLAHQMERLLNSTGEGIYGLDLDGRCILINRAGAEMLGYAPEELLGQRIHDLIHPATAEGQPNPEAQSPIVDAYRRGDACQDDSEVFSRKDGTKLPVQVSCFPTTEGGEITGAVVTFSDMTQRLRLQEQLRQAQKMEAIGLLAGGVAHDFNNLLCVVQLHASLLETPGMVGPEGIESVKEILQASERAASLTRQLLAFSRKQIAQPRVLQLNDVVLAMTKMLLRVMGENIELIVSCDPRLPRIYADPGMIEQIILNLAVNSRDAMPSGGRLSLSTVPVTLDLTNPPKNAEARMGEFVCLSVVDTGSGIGPEHLPHIFEPFFTTKELGKGTGLGLSTVYGIVKQHEGWIEVSSQTGRGTTFDIFLPVSRDDAAAQAPGAPPAEIPRGTETILLVEDDPALRQLAQGALERYGYTVLSAENGPAALNVWKGAQDRVSLLFTDVIMPGEMTGFQLAERLQKEKPGLRTIFTSGYPADQTGRDFSAIHFLQKPYNRERLLRLIRKALDKH